VDAEEAVRLRRAIGRLARQFNTSATDENLTPTQASVLGLIVGHGPVAIAELVRLEHINPTMLSRVVGKLTDVEVITRTPDPDDLRSVRLEVTAHGREVHERIKAQRAHAVARGAEHLTASEQASLVKALAALEHLGDALGAD
jgi:DNA-binding MarR family transcriptional regulator